METQEKIKELSEKFPQIASRIKLNISERGEFNLESDSFSEDISNFALCAISEAKTRQSAIREQIDNSYKIVLIYAGIVAGLFLTLSSFYITLQIKQNLAPKAINYGYSRYFVQ